jgi:hypothetical protein
MMWNGFMIKRIKKKKHFRLPCEKPTGVSRSVNSFGLPLGFVHVVRPARLPAHVPRAFLENESWRNLTWRASSKTSKNMNVWTLFPHCPVGDIVLVCQEAGVRWVWYIIWNQCDSFIYLNLIVKNRKIIIERYFKWWWLLYKHGFCVSGGIESLVGHPTVPQQLPLKPPPPPHVTLLHKPPYSHREITNHRQTSW